MTSELDLPDKTECFNKVCKVINSITKVTHIEATINLMSEYNDLFSDWDDYIQFHLILIDKINNLKCLNKTL